MNQPRKGGASLAARITALVLLGLAGAHFLRMGAPGWLAGFLAVGLALCLAPETARRWLVPAAAGLLLFAAVMWAVIGAQLIQTRVMMGLPWLRLVAIMAGLLAVTLVGAVWLLRSRAAGPEIPGKPAAQTAVQASVFLATVGLLALAQAKAPLSLTLAERFAPGWGGAEMVALGFYAAWLMPKLLDVRDHARWRPRIWALFSAVFFLQLLLGLVGVSRMLMTGALHLPVPALIIAGPLYRGHGVFMLVLFSVSLLLVGPAWCSHLCYIGAWDDLCSRRHAGKAVRFPRWVLGARVIVLAVVVAAALGLRWAGVPTLSAVWLTAGFGVGGVLVMLSASRATGRMIHCTGWCPMGLVGNLVGKLSPWRLRIADGCTECGRCSRVCRYGALAPADLRRGRPGLSCTLCGECLPACREAHLGYRFPGLAPEAARRAFLVCVVVLHAVFLGVARI